MSELEGTLGGGHHLSAIVSDFLYDVVWRELVSTHLGSGTFSVLPLEGASFCKPCFSACRLTEVSRAANTQDCGLCTVKTV